MIINSKTCLQNKSFASIDLLLKEQTYKEEEEYFKKIRFINQSMIENMYSFIN